MKLSKIMLAMTLVMGVNGAVLAEDAGSGRVTFSGSIIDAPCSISPESSDQEVDLGQVSKNALKDKGKSTPRNFQILLENCDISGTDIGGGEDGSETRATASTVSIRFGGSEAEGGDKTQLGITGTATGAGVVITDASGVPVELNTESSNVHELLEGNNTMNFSAYLQGISNEIETGEFTAVADFSLSYQ